MNLDRLYIVTIENNQENYDDCLRRVTYMSLPHETIYEFRGVNGKQVFETKQDLVNYGIKEYDGWNIGPNANGFWSRDLTRGELGCIASHIEIWEDAYENGYENIMILEDDFFPIRPLDWESIEPSLDDIDWDLFYLGRIVQESFNILDSPSDDLITQTGFSYQTHAYMLSKEGIRKMVEDHLPILKQNIIPADEFLPCTYGMNPRSDIQNMYTPNINSYGFTDWENRIIQMRTEIFGNSQTAPEEGIDY